MTTFPVSHQKTEKLLRDFQRLGIREADLEETFVRSGGPGGQNVNKVSSCVVVKHIPTGLTVKCQQDRSQAMNRYFARRILADRIEAERLGKKSEKAREIYRIKRQKKKRSKRAQEKVLRNKLARSEKKQFRRKVGDQE